MSIPLILCGASVRAAAFSARRAGFAPHGIDLFGDRDLAEMATAVQIDRYPAGFLPALATAPTAPWIYTGGLENHPQLVERMSRLRPLWGNGGKVLQAVRDPQQLAIALARHGLAYPAIDPVNPHGRRWLLKPRRGSAGLGIRRWSEGETLPIGPGQYLQEYIPGQSLSAVFVAARGEAQLLGVTRQLIGSDWGLMPEFLYLGSIGPLLLTNSERATLLKLGQVLAGEFDLVGLFNVDLVQSEGEFWTVEMNPRYSASVEVLERGSGASFLALHAAACQNSGLPQLPLCYPSEVAGKAVVYARRSGRWTLALDAVARGDHQRSDWPVFADIPQMEQVFTAGQPVVTVLASGASVEQVEHRLRSREAELLALWEQSAG